MGEVFFCWISDLVSDAETDDSLGILDTKFILELEDPKYISKMRSPYIWGGSNEILAACNIWKIKVNVFIDENKKKKIEMLPIDGNYVKIINLHWKDGNHYDPIITN